MRRERERERRERERGERERERGGWNLSVRPDPEQALVSFTSRACWCGLYVLYMVSSKYCALGGYTQRSVNKSYSERCTSKLRRLSQKLTIRVLLKSFDGLSRMMLCVFQKGNYDCCLRLRRVILSSWGYCSPCT